MTALVVFACIWALLGVWLGRRFYQHPIQGVAALAFVAPLEKLSVYHGITWKPFLPVFIILAAAVLLRRLTGKEPWPALSIVDKAFILITCVNLFSSVVAVSPERTLRMTVQFAILFGITHFTIHYIRSFTDARFVLFFTFLSGGLVLAYGLIQLAGGLVGIDTHVLLRVFPKNPTLPYMLLSPGAVFFPGLGRHVVRVSSTFYDWNYFGGYLLMLLCLSSALLVYRHRLGGRRTHLLFLVFTSLILFVFTFSRSAWIGSLPAAALLYRLFRDALGARDRRRYLGAALLLAVIANLALGNPARLAVDRLAFMFRGDPSITKHGIYGRAALEMFYGSPLLGIGLHNFAVHYQQAYDGNDVGATAHSTFLTYFAETGVLGALGHLFLHTLAIFLLVRGIRQSRRLSFEYCVLAGSLAAYSGILVCNVFYFFNNQAFIWTLLGFGLGVSRLVTSWHRSFAYRAQVSNPQVVTAPGA